MPESGVTTAAPAALRVDNVESGYGRTVVLRDVSIEVPAGAVVAMLGPNGAGKTTLLRTVSGLLVPSKGRLHMNGDDVTKLAPHERTRRGLCHIPEGRGVYRSLTVRDNLVLFADRGSERSATERAVSVFPRLGDRLDQVAGSLSGGEQQMLAMSRAYIRNPKLLLVDEASLGLAPIIVDAIFSFIESMARAGSSILIVDQFVGRALSLADHAYLMTRGEIVYSGPPQELLDQSVFERYLGGDVSPVSS